MTGFGSGRAEDAAGAVEVQIAAVNHRSCQINVRSDLRNLASEERLRQALRRRVQRGSITLRVDFISSAPGGLRHTELSAAWRGFKDLADELGAPAPSLEGVARLLGADRAAGPDDATLDAALDAALTAFVADRRREGAALTAAFDAMLAELEDLRARLESAAAERLPAYRERLAGRLREVLPEFGEVDEAALVRECALQAERVDVEEELVRLASHCRQLAGLLATEGEKPVGRRLDFLLQEVLREVNTVGSKANDAELTGLVVAAKSVVDRMKEQAANVE